MIGFLLLGELAFTGKENVIVHFFRLSGTQKPDEL